MRKAVKAMETVTANGFVTLLSVTCILPIIWMIYSSLRTDQKFSLDILNLPKKLIFDNCAQAIKEGNIGSYFMSSMLNTLITVIVVIVIALMTGYCLSRSKLRGRTLMYYIFLSGTLIPIYALLVPISVEFKLLGPLNKRYTLILPYIAFAFPVAVFLVEGSMASVPIEIEEAAYIDGSSFLYTMFAIIMSTYRPVLSTSAILIFLNTWNEFPPALVSIRSNPPKTMPIGLTNFVGSYTVNYPLMLAALMVSTLPMVTMYLLLYNQIMKGVTAGTVKG